MANTPDHNSASRSEHGVPPHESLELPPDAATAVPSAGGVGLLLIVTLIWGTTFVATKSLVGGTTPAMSPGGVTFWRFLIAAVCFLPFVLVRPWPRGLWRVGLELSFWLWAGYATQAIGLKYTSVSKSAFVTSLNVVFVPVLTVLAGRRVGWIVWLMVGVALAGAGLLSYDGSDPNIGDLWTLGCAITYAVYIVRLERYANRFPAGSLTMVQLLGVTAFSLPWMAGEATIGGFGWGRWTPSVVLAIVYMGVIATLVTTWLQALGQRTVPGTHASLLYMTEPVFASAIAILFFDEQLGGKGWMGAGLILLAAIVSQVGPMWLRRITNRRVKSSPATD